MKNARRNYINESISLKRIDFIENCNKIVQSLQQKRNKDEKKNNTA